eukprot:TRINITY_DN4956_c0_g2_i5.p1 TRINITY_DN4956_c0_g2~~TRINITY_DN4956_c0_g2_i5.p1  ORF type:complete len:118 (-),score=8.98 TRINITY_DN4956_c0_g2_i5:197-550(-)
MEATCPTHKTNCGSHNLNKPDCSLIKANRCPTNKAHCSHTKANCYKPNGWHHPTASPAFSSSAAYPASDSAAAGSHPACAATSCTATTSCQRDNPSSQVGGLHSDNLRKQNPHQVIP